jgi:hypothetical protein
MGTRRAALHLDLFEQLPMNGGPPPPDENGAIRPRLFALVDLAGDFPSSLAQNECIRSYFELQGADDEILATGMSKGDWLACAACRTFIERIRSEVDRERFARRCATVIAGKLRTSQPAFFARTTRDSCGLNGNSSAESPRTDRMAGRKSDTAIAWTTGGLGPRPTRASRLRRRSW